VLRVWVSPRWWPSANPRSVAEYPWIFDYSDDPVVGTDSRWGRAVFRPLVEIRVIGPHGESERVFALVDSGTEYTLMMRWVAQSIGAEADTARSIPLGLGGEVLNAAPADVELRFGPSDELEQEWVQWPTQVGVIEHWKAQWPVVLGQRGFFDQFTVTMSRHCQQIAIESRDKFDQRYG
jgi:hypothetical protein